MPTLTAIAWIFAVMGAPLLSCFDVEAADFATSRLDPTACIDVKKLNLPNTTLVKAQTVPAGTFIAPDQRSYYVRRFCRVHGVSKPTSDSHINFEVWLPASGWNGRYYQHGEGGGGGAINYTALAGLVNEGAAAGATDNGHRRDAALSYDWAYGHPQRIIDFGYRALKATRDHAQQIIHEHYGKPPHHYYFAGCSGGGAEALMAAQRFAAQWDGILSGAPDQDAIGFYASSAWQAHRWLTRPEGRIPPSQLAFIERAALASCSAEAHVEDGIAADPRFCPFDPQTLLCRSTEDGACLTAAQIQTLRNIYHGPPARNTGKPLYQGFPPTLESGWATVITGGAGFPFHIYEKDEPTSVPFAVRFFRAFVFEDANWDLRSLELERDIKLATMKPVGGETLAGVLNADRTDLSALRDRGAKLMIYVGWGDAAISPLEIISYYEGIAERMGGLNKAAQFTRLFVVPGMGHCGGGMGANAFGQMPSGLLPPALQNDTEHNMMRALESWVEAGSAPDHLIAAKYLAGDPAKGVAFTRPTCSYPLVPAYKGSGSKALAENFNCVSGEIPLLPR